MLQENHSAENYQCCQGLCRQQLPVAHSATVIAVDSWLCRISLFVTESSVAVQLVQLVLPFLGRTALASRVSSGRFVYELWLHLVLSLFRRSTKAQKSPFSRLAGTSLCTVILSSLCSEPLVKYPKLPYPFGYVRMAERSKALRSGRSLLL